MIRRPPIAAIRAMVGSCPQSRQVTEARARDAPFAVHDKGNSMRDAELPQLLPIAPTHERGAQSTVLAHRLQPGTARCPDDTFSLAIRRHNTSSVPGKRRLFKQPRPDLARRFAADQVPGQGPRGNFTLAQGAELPDL